MYKLLSRLHGTIPKSQRYTLWQRCETINLTLLELLLEAAAMKEKERLPILLRMSRKLDLLKVLIRLAKDTKTIDLKKYTTIETILQESGKMMGGWIKSASH
ncbi:MAG: four helix bundle protein [Simkaniaceae bacterium]|nr:four helix bundle protein [Simkaniaceae bacterium]